MRTTTPKLLIFGSAFALTLAACDKAPDQRSTAPRGDTTASRPADTSKGPIDRTQAIAADASITAKVKGKFVADDQLKAHEINVDTKDGVVTLRGSVQDPTAKDRATQVAREVEGVTSVDNQLVVRSS